MSDEKLTMRRALLEDAPLLFDMIGELAEYEKMQADVTGTASMLRDNMESGLVHALIAEYDGHTAGFALYFFNYSTFKSKRGLYLEDLFVRPAFRKLGIGKALFLQLVDTAASSGYGRMDWCCLNWNALSIAFYQHMGARPLNEWTTWRLDEADFPSLHKNRKDE